MPRRRRRSWGQADERRGQHHRSGEGGHLDTQQAVEGTVGGSGSTRREPDAVGYCCASASGGGDCDNGCIGGGTLGGQGLRRGEGEEPIGGGFDGGGDGDGGGGGDGGGDGDDGAVAGFDGAGGFDGGGAEGVAGGFNGGSGFNGSGGT